MITSVLAMTRVETMPKVIALDYGDAKIGVAIGSPEVKIAHPRAIWHAKEYSEILGKLKEILQVEDVDKILIGCPVGLQGQSTVQTQKVKQFFDWLKDNVSIPVELIDERYSTQSAQKLIDDNKREDDDVAAMILLQQYFDKL